MGEILSHVRTLVRTRVSTTLPVRARTVVDDFEDFINTIDWDVRMRSTAFDEDEITHARIELASPVDPEVIRAAKEAIRERFGIDVEITVEDIGPSAPGADQ